MSQTCNDTFDVRAFRSALGKFTTGVAIATTTDSTGRPVGITINSFSSVSLAPPMVLWSIAKESLSLSAFEHNDYFAVTILTAKQKKYSQRFSRRGVDKFADVVCKEGIGGVPLFKNFSAQFQCRKAHQYEGGDHYIFVGEVLAFEATESPPLVFYGGQYAAAQL